MKFFDELKRRNVIKATIAYIVVAWVLLQVLTSVLPNLGTPPWVLKTLMFLMAIGLPIWVIFSWVYEITPEGLKKTAKVSEDQSITTATNKRLNIIIIITLIIAIAVSFINKPIPNTPSKTIANKELMLDNTIAVIPFKNWSGDPNLEYVSDGMTDAVISRLTKIKSIDRVIPFTSMVKYKESDKSMLEIAKELGVRNILQGNFQLSGNRLKINLQLINGPLDKHFWSHEYSGEWQSNEIFKIQAAVAENVAKNMNVMVLDTDLEAIQKIPTDNKEAYNLFLQAKFQSNKFNRNGFENSIPLYERAIALDPSFTEAYIGLAGVWSAGGAVWGMYDEQQAWKKTKSLLQNALEIDSTDSRVYEKLHLGYFLYEWDFDLLENVYQTNLNLAVESKVYLSDYALKTGRYHEALSPMNWYILANPTYGFPYASKAQILMLLGKKKEAINLLEKTDPLYNDDMFYLRETAKLYYYLGKYEKSKNQLEKLMDSFIERPSIVLWLNAVYQHMDGNEEGVTEYLSELNKRYENGDSGSPAWFMALYYCTVGDYENAFTWLQKSYNRHEVEMTWLREEPLLIPLRDDQRYLELYTKMGFPVEPYSIPE